MATQHEFLYPPLSAITPTDRRGIYWIIGVICVCHILLTLLLRLMVRWRRFQIDDYAVVAGCILFLAQTGVAFGAVALHLGSADGGEDESRVSTAWHLFLASEALYVIGLYAAKLTVLLTVQSLLARDMAVRGVFHCTLGAVAVLGLASLLTVLVGCDDGHSLLTGGGDNCNRETRWIAVATMDALSELWGFALFCWVVWSLQMRSSYKITASAMVGLRLLCIFFAAMHVNRVEQFVNSSRPSTIVIRPLVWQTVGLTYSLFSAMAIALRPFLKDFHTGMGMDLGHAADYGSGSRKTKECFKMQNMSPEGTRDQKGGNTEDVIAASSPAESTVFTPEDQNYVAEICHANRKASNGSMRSEDPIIRKQVDYDVTYER